MGNNIFNGNNEEKKQAEFIEKVDDHTKALLTVIQRQKDLENTLDLMNEKIELLDHNSIKNFKKSFQDLKNAKVDVRELKTEIKKNKEFNSKITKQLKLMSTKDDVT